MSRSTRRRFLKSGAGLAAASVAARAVGGASGSNDRICIGVIGCGGQAQHLMRSFASMPDVIVKYVCDVDAARVQAAVKTVGEAVHLAAAKAGTSSSPAPTPVEDLRRVLDDRQIDAVIIATPDHWHAPATILACTAGKHVYAEKPCSHNLREGRLMVEAARRHKRVVQLGTQSRSLPHVVKAMQLLREGIIGEVLVTKAWTNQLRANIGHKQPTEPPPGLNYDLWVGPAPFVPYRSNCAHYTWRWWYNFGTGDIGNDGVHELDIARWALGVDTHPTTIAARGGKYFFDDDQQFPDTYSVIYEYGDPPNPPLVRGGPTSVASGDIQIPPLATGGFGGGGSRRPDALDSSATNEMFVFHRTTGNVIVGASSLNAGAWSLLGTGDVFTMRGTFSPADTADPAIVSTVGGCIITEDPTNWTTYHVPEMQTMGAGIMKFQLSYDNDWKNGTPSTYDCSYGEISSAIANGARVIILRTADTKTDASSVAIFMGAMRFRDTASTAVANLPSLLSTVRWIIEVGNEPDQVVPNFSASTARNNALSVISSVKPNYPGFQWMVSMPTDHPKNGSGFSYISTFMAASGGKTVQDQYDLVGVHCYNPNSLYWIDGTAHPLNIMDYCLARLPYGKLILVSEANVNNYSLDWGTKGGLLRDALFAAPAVVRGWTYFAMTTDPLWNMNGTFYGIDENTGYIVREIWTGSTTTFIVAGQHPQDFPIGKPATVVGAQSCHNPSNSNLSANGNWNVVSAIWTALSNKTRIEVNLNSTGWTAYDTVNRPGFIAPNPLRITPGIPAATALGAR